MKKNKEPRIGYGSLAFRKLQNEWYAKLKSQGFADIEKDERNVRQYSSNAYRQASLLERATKLAYYTAMEHQAKSYHFTSIEQQYVILRASQGAFVSEIVKELKSRGIPLYKHTVIRIIRRFEHETGIRQWTLKQRYQRHERLSNYRLCWVRVTGDLSPRSFLKMATLVAFRKRLFQVD